MRKEIFSGVYWKIFSNKVIVQRIKRAAPFIVLRILGSLRPTQIKD